MATDALATAESLNEPVASWFDSEMDRVANELDALPDPKTMVDELDAKIDYAERGAEESLRIDTEFRGDEPSWLKVERARTFGAALVLFGDMRLGDLEQAHTLGDAIWLFGDRRLGELARPQVDPPQPDLVAQLGINTTAQALQVIENLVVGMAERVADERSRRVEEIYVEARRQLEAHEAGTAQRTDDFKSSAVYQDWAEAADQAEVALAHADAVCGGTEAGNSR